MADQVLWLRKSRFSGVVEILLSHREMGRKWLKQRCYAARVTIVGLPYLGTRDLFKTGGGRCKERLRVWMIGSRVHVVLQSLSSGVWGIW